MVLFIRFRPEYTIHTIKFIYKQPRFPFQKPKTYLLYNTNQNNQNEKVHELSKTTIQYINEPAINLQKPLTEKTEKRIRTTNKRIFT